MIDSRMEPVLDLYMTDYFYKFIGFSVETCSAGKCRIILKVTERVLSPAGKVHGGIINALCSYASSLAAMSVVAPGKYTTASDFNISVFKNVSSGNIICEGTVLKSGKRLIFVETTVKSESEELLAAGRVTKVII